MDKDISFQLDTKGAEDILTKLAAPQVKQSADAISARARAMASKLTTNPPDINVTTAVGTIRRGSRAIATVRASGDDAHSNYIGHIVLAKARDAGRLN